MLTKPFFLIVVAAALLLHHRGLAQESVAPNPKMSDRWWINLGVGFGGGAPDANNDIDSSPIAANASISYQFGANLVSLRTAATTNLDGFFFVGEVSSAEDIALLYGRSTKSKGAQASLAAGIGFAKITSQEFLLFFPTSEFKTERTTGLALETQLFVQPAGFLGLGLYGYANLNSKSSFYGVALNLRLGKLR